MAQKRDTETGEVIDCTTCRHYVFHSVVYATCEAFPKGIPVEFLMGDEPHDVPHKAQADRTILWESGASENVEEVEAQ
tara:strand:+ start:95 stop:328 length:234 start_codon:yes stop_codon:yes gene_type:complete